MTSYNKLKNHTDHNGNVSDDDSGSGSESLVRHRKVKPENAEQYFDKARRLYLPNDKKKRGEYLSKAAADVNSAVFQKNTEKFLTLNSASSRDVRKLPAEERMDCIALSVSKDGKSGVISGNVKERLKCTQSHKEYGQFGFNEQMHGDVIRKTLSEKAPAARSTNFDVIGNTKPPTDRKENAMLHAEMQQVSYGVDSSSHMGVSKPPCVNCESVLKEHGFENVFYAGEGQNLKPKNWIAPEPQDRNNNPSLVEKKFEIPKKKVIVESDMNLKSYTKVKVQNDSISEHVARNITKSIKPKINASIQAAIETAIEDIDREPGTYNVGPNACAGTYEGKRMPMVGAYARASTWDAGAHCSVAHARVNGPAAGAGVHASVLGVGAYANAEVARAEVSVLGVTAAVGLNFNTGASAGVDGVSASFLGFGVSVGPSLAVRTPVADVSCSIV